MSDEAMDKDMDEDMDKDALLSQMRASYERIEAALAALTPQQWTAAREPGAWSARDVVAHLTSWLDRLVDTADAALKGTRPELPVAGLSDAEVDAWNAKSSTLHRDDTPQQALGAFRMSYGQLVDKIHLLPWDDLATVGRFAWLGETPLWRLISEDTWEHFDEHLPEIERARGDAQG
jgi:hypothetical protein